MVISDVNFCLKQEESL